MAVKQISDLDKATLKDGSEFIVGPDKKTFLSDIVKYAGDLIIPVGMIYTQYPLEKAPWEIWKFTTQSNWQNISSHYAGLFSRIEGGDAETFEKKLACTVSGTSVTLTGYSGSTAHGVTTSSLIIDTNTWEQREVTAVSNNVLTINSAFSNPTKITNVLIVQNETLPNIKGQVNGGGYIENVSWGMGVASVSGAFTGLYDNRRLNTPNVTYGSNFNGTFGYKFNASLSNKSYKDGAKVRPKTYTVKIWKRVN